MTSNSSPALISASAASGGLDVACLDRPARQLRREDASIGRVVVDDQGPLAAEVDRMPDRYRDRERDAGAVCSRTASLNVEPLARLS